MYTGMKTDYTSKLLTLYIFFFKMLSTSWA